MKDRLKRKLKALERKSKNTAHLQNQLPENMQNFEKGMEAVEKIYIEIKNHQPHLLEEFKETVTREMTDEEKQEFFENVARRESANASDS